LGQPSETNPTFGILVLAGVNKLLTVILLSSIHCVH